MPHKTMMAASQVEGAIFLMMMLLGTYHKRWCMSTHAWRYQYTDVLLTSNKMYGTKKMKRATLYEFPVSMSRSSVMP